MCERKRRALQKDEKRVQAGFMAYNRFWQLTQNSKKPKSYDDFADSSYYNAFVKFGSFMSNVKPLYPEKYIDWMVTGGEKIDNWAKDELYEKYVVELIFKESVETALERSINTMTEWAEENNSSWNHYFSYVNHNRAIWHIKDGKISPWLLLNCDSGKKLLKQFNNEQLSMVYQILDPQKWSIKFKKYPADLALVKDVAKQANL